MKLYNQESNLINNNKTRSTINKRILAYFTQTLLIWYGQHGRHDLPWQSPYSAYRVWISEIMLQQTQVKTVIPYFLRFIAHYPDIQVLAQAPLDDVLTLWSGLGYYSRARNLHRTAQLIVSDYQGEFPKDLLQLQALPGIGPSTAAAIASLAFEQPAAILDGNVKRVLSRYFRVSGHGRDYEVQLWELAHACMPTTQCRAYTQAIMDLGALCCTPKQPSCHSCPLNSQCQAFLAHEVAAYPQQKPKKTRPIRNEQFLLFYTEDQKIYLEQRALKGIWGGLWTFPSLSEDTHLTNHLQSHYAITAPIIQPFMTYKHQFTHFQLHISVLTILIEANPNWPGTWFPSQDILGLGIPKPVRDMIEKFLSGTQALSGLPKAIP